MCWGGFPPMSPHVYATRSPSTGRELNSTFPTLGLQLKNWSVVDGNHGPSAVRNSATSGVSYPSNDAAFTAWGHMSKSKPTTAVRVPRRTRTSIASATMSTGVIPDVNGTPDPVVMIVPAHVTAFVTMFPGIAVPRWMSPMVETIIGAFALIDPAARATAAYADWMGALNTSDPSVRPANGHRYTGGSGADVARTQNAIYVACAVSGIPRRDIPNAFGAAMWRFILGATRCDYAVHVDYFASTLSGYCGHAHNDTPGIDNTTAENVVRVWRDTKPGAAVVADGA